MQRAGRSVEHGREVVRDNPLGINEGATGEAQLWVLVSQIRQELQLAQNADVLVLDRGVMDNFAYYLRACGGEDLFDVAPLVTRWSAGYDMVVRLRPDIALRSDGVRSTSDTFRDEIENILDARLPSFVTSRQLVDLNASDIDDSFDWWPLAERLASLVEEPLYADGVRRRRPRPMPRQKPDIPQLEMEI
jgi:nicotinamide riboside kinase